MTTMEHKNRMMKGVKEEIQNMFLEEELIGLGREAY